MRNLTRREFLRLGGAAVGVALMPGALAGTAGLETSAREAARSGVNSEASRPNIVLVTVDTLRADRLAAYGHPYIQTPTLDRIAAEGARFTSHVVQEPQTNPSHASMFTGMYPASDGVRAHMVDLLPDNLETLATVFSAAGYATAGLFSFASFDPEYCNFQRGFDVYRDLTADQPGLLSSEIGTKGRADLTTEAAISQIRSFGSNHFFLWVHYFDPHYPYEPPAPYLTLYDPDYAGQVDGSMATIDAIQNDGFVPAGADLRHLVSVYEGAVSFVDAQLARLVAELDRREAANNTILAVTADHGEEFGEHRWLEEGVSFFHPHSLYASEVRVPLLLRYPGLIRGGTIVDVPTQGIDLLPTVATAAGLPVPEQAQGRSLFPLLNGTSATDAPAFSAMPDYTFASVTVPGWKLIQNNATEEHALFDLGEDEAESRDVSRAEPGKTRELARLLNGWMRQVGIS